MTKTPRGIAARTARGAGTAQKIEASDAKGADHLLIVAIETEGGATVVVMVTGIESVNGCEKGNWNGTGGVVEDPLNAFVTFPGTVAATGTNPFAARRPIPAAEVPVRTLVAERVWIALIAVARVPLVVVVVKQDPRAPSPPSQRRPSPWG